MIKILNLTYPCTLHIGLDGHPVNTYKLKLKLNSKPPPYPPPLKKNTNDRK